MGAYSGREQLIPLDFSTDCALQETMLDERRPGRVQKSFKKIARVIYWLTSESEEILQI